LDGSSVADGDVADDEWCRCWRDGRDDGDIALIDRLVFAEWRRIFVVGPPKLRFIAARYIMLRSSLSD